MQNIIHCPVCGKILKSERICSGCGYDPVRDYELHPTLGPIPKGTESVSTKHSEYERKVKQTHITDEKPATKHKRTNAILIPIIITIIALVFVLPIILNTKESKKKDNEETSQETSSLEDVVTSDSEIFQGFESLEVGDTFIFGAYEQDDNMTNGKEEIEWIILDKEDKSLFLISKYTLDCQLYNITRTDVTWDTCTLCDWLNSTFLNSAFTDEEQKMIPSVVVSADENLYDDTDQGSDTTNQVFLLSVQEVLRFFSTDEERKCSPTPYAVQQGVYTDSRYKQDGRDAGIWWLRSMRWDNKNAMCVYADGSVDKYDYVNVYNVDVGVRPALWINLESVVK